MFSYQHLLTPVVLFEKENGTETALLKVVNETRKT